MSVMRSIMAPMQNCDRRNASAMSRFPRNAKWARSNSARFPRLLSNGTHQPPSPSGRAYSCLTSRREIANHGLSGGFQDGLLRLQVGVHPSMLTGTKRRLVKMREDALLMLLIVMPIMVAILAFGSVALFHLG
jgi:hypothetical protein